MSCYISKIYWQHFDSRFRSLMLKMILETVFTKGKIFDIYNYNYILL